MTSAPLTRTPRTVRGVRVTVRGHAAPVTRAHGAALTAPDALTLTADAHGAALTGGRVFAPAQGAGGVNTANEPAHMLTALHAAPTHSTGESAMSNTAPTADRIRAIDAQTYRLTVTRVMNMTTTADIDAFIMALPNMGASEGQIESLSRMASERRETLTALGTGRKGGRKPSAASMARDALRLEFSRILSAAESVTDLERRLTAARILRRDRVRSGDMVQLELTREDVILAVARVGDGTGYRAGEEYRKPVLTKVTLEVHIETLTAVERRADEVKARADRVTLERRLFTYAARVARGEARKLSLNALETLMSHWTSDEFFASGAGEAFTLGSEDRAAVEQAHAEKLAAKVQ